MKRIWMLVIAVVALALPSLTPAQDLQEWSASLYWDIRNKRTCAVAVRTMGEIRKPFGLRFDLSGDVFGGSTFDGELLAGFAVSGAFPVAQNVQFKLGIGTNWRFDQPVNDAGLGLLIGLNWRF